jgi:hypothetical protein
MSLEISDDLSRVMDMINEVEWIRKQIYDPQARCDAHDRYGTVVAAGKTSVASEVAEYNTLLQNNNLGGPITIQH